MYDPSKKMKKLCAQKMRISVSQQEENHQEESKMMFEKNGGRISPLHFVLHFSFFFIFYFIYFLFQPHYLTNSIMNSTQMHCLWVPQNPLFNYFFIKNGLHNTIYKFKNYFATVFSVSIKINSIQTDPRFPFHF